MKSSKFCCRNADLLFIFQEQSWLKERNLGCPQCLCVVVTQGQCFPAQSGRDRFLFAQVYLTATEKDLINMGKSDTIKGNCLLELIYMHAFKERYIM